MFKLHFAETQESQTALDGTAYAMLQCHLSKTQCGLFWPGHFSPHNYHPVVVRLIFLP